MVTNSIFGETTMKDLTQLAQKMPMPKNVLLCDFIVSFGISIVSMITVNGDCLALFHFDAKTSFPKMSSAALMLSTVTGQL